MLKVDVVSPSGKVISEKEFNVVIAPSQVGELTVLPGHIDALCLLGNGQLKLDDKEDFIVYKGVMEISDGDKVVIAAEKIKKVSELDINETKSSLKELEEKLLNQPMDDVEMHKTREDYEERLAELLVLT